MFKKYFPDAKDEKFLAVDEGDGDGKFSIEWKDLKNGEGATRVIWKEGDFLVDPETFSEELIERRFRKKSFISIHIIEDD